VLGFRQGTNAAWLGAMIFLCSVCVWSSELSAEQKQQLIGIAREGLDTHGNRIDALIAAFGYICVRNPYNPRPCRIESELLELVRGLPRDPTIISRRLQEMGARCVNDSARLQCTYEREVVTTAWVAGNSTPSNALRDSFRIEFIVEKRGASLDVKILFQRNGA